MLIINADDFGLNSDTNEAIAESFRMGLCSSTTIIANGPAFDEAVDIARLSNLTGKIGLHVNLAEFMPLSSRLKEADIFCDSSGCFKRDWRVTYSKGVLLNKLQKELLYDEIKLQIEKCLDNGLVPTHIDSHAHIHTIPGISGVILKAAKKYNIKKIRISRNCGRISFQKRVIKSLFNSALHMRGFVTTDYFGSIEDVLLLYKSSSNAISEKTVEIMCHPRKQGNEIVDLDGSLLSEMIEMIDNYRSALSYLDL